MSSLCVIHVPDIYSHPTNEWQTNKLWSNLQGLFQLWISGLHFLSSLPSLPSSLPLTPVQPLWRQPTRTAFSDMTRFCSQRECSAPFEAHPHTSWCVYTHVSLVSHVLVSFSWLYLTWLKLYSISSAYCPLRSVIRGTPYLTDPIQPTWLLFGWFGGSLLGCLGIDDWCIWYLWVQLHSPSTFRIPFNCILTSVLWILCYNCRKLMCTFWLPWVALLDACTCVIHTIWLTRLFQCTTIVFTPTNQFVNYWTLNSLYQVWWLHRQ